MITVKHAMAGTVAAMMVVAVSVPAQANVRRFTDARNDTSSSVDIRSVRVDNSTTARDKVIVVVQQDDVRPNDSISVYLDVQRRNPGPEYVIGGATASEVGMRRITRWQGGPGHPVPYTCGYRLKIHAGVDRTRAAISRSCMGNPGAVRVAVKVERGYPPTSRDWARNYRTWLPWVAR